jgi:hypothetical protein
MPLPKYITGFYHVDETPPPTLVNGKQFIQLCYDIASRNGGKVIDFRPPEFPRNFYNAKVEMFDEQFHILLNEHYPFLAYASVVEVGNFSFIDKPILNEYFSPFYRIWKTDELNKRIRPNLLKELAPLELEQIAYWKPKTIGQIIFNYWD